MRRFFIPVALLFVAFTASAQTTDKQNFSFNLGVRMPVVLTFNNPDEASTTAMLEVDRIDGNGNVLSVRNSALAFSLPSVTSTNPFEIRARAASYFWKKADGSDSDISVNDEAMKKMTVMLHLTSLKDTEFGKDLMIPELKTDVNANAAKIIAYTDNAMTAEKGIQVEYRVYPGGVNMADLTERVSITLDYTLLAK